MRNAFALTPNERDWITMEQQGFTAGETAQIFNSWKNGHRFPLSEAHAKIRAQAQLQRVLDKNGRGTSLGVARGYKRMEGSR